MRGEKLKIKLALFSISLLFTMIFSYTVYLKVAKGEEFEQRALRQYTNRYDVQLFPMRGSIYDRGMKELAVSVPVYNVILDPVVLNENSKNDEIRKENIEKTLNSLSSSFNVDMETLRRYMETDEEGQLLRPSSYVKIKKGISRTEADSFKELDVKGVWLEEDSTREYPYNQLAANLIGFIRGDAIWGLERYYDEMLTGEAGRAFITYTNSATPVINKVPPRNGHQVITTIDAKLQEYAEEVLKDAVEAYKPQNGALLALNPNTGEILAMALYPSFNPNKPMEPIYMDNPEFAALWEMETDATKIDTLNGMWKNYSITSTFEPGSIFKPMVIAAALDEGIISLNDTFFCGGGKQVYDRYIKCHHEPGHGIQTVEEVLANSCNVAMMDIGALLGPELFYKHFANFGFGEKTEIDLPGEESAQYVVYSNQDFRNPVNLATSSFGQGSSCTPIQALNAFAAVINGGQIMKPYIVSHVMDESGNTVLSNSPVIVRKILSEETSDNLRHMLKAVVDYGTGKKAKIPGYSIGGKTGTGEQGVRSKKENTLTFIGYLPVEDPQIVALALLDKPYDNQIQGSASAAPMLKGFFEKAIQYMAIKPSNEAEVSEDMFIPSDSITVPDFQEMTMANATEILLSGGLKYEASGGGNIIQTQWPKPGTKVERGTTITLHTRKTEGEILTVPVPNVIGLSEDAAFKELIENSFAPTVEENENAGKIVSQQYPQAGQHVFPETEVSLKFSEPTVEPEE